MLGTRAPETLPGVVVDSVLAVHEDGSDALGPVRFEWVFDGDRTWVVQLHVGTVAGAGQVIYPGDRPTEHRFLVQLGLEALRELVDRIDPDREAVVLVGGVGVTSHFGDVLRKARVPSRLAAE
jgi:hypothetical protein